MQWTIWRHIRLELPADWEMLQFSRNMVAGRCAFADRTQFRAELSWQAVSGPPDLERLASDYLAKRRLDGTIAGGVSPRRDSRGGDVPPTLARVGEWHGLRCHEGGLLTSRFSRYLGEEGCLIEFVLLWPQGLDASLEADILARVAAERPWPGGWRRWRAFGLDALAPGNLDLVECVAQPALARLGFADAREEHQVTFERLGMVPQWLRGSVRDWLARQVPSDLRDASEGRAEANGHQVEGLSGLRRGGALRRPTRYAAAAWLCPADGRLYRVAVTGLGAVEGGRPALDRLSCCEGKPLRG